MKPVSLLFEYSPLSSIVFVTSDLEDVQDVDWIIDLISNKFNRLRMTIIKHLKKELKQHSIFKFPYRSKTISFWTWEKILCYWFSDNFHLMFQFSVPDQPYIVSDIEGCPPIRIASDLPGLTPLSFISVPFSIKRKEGLVSSSINFYGNCFLSSLINKRPLKKPHFCLDNGVRIKWNILDLN